MAIKITESRQNILKMAKKAETKYNSSEDLKAGLLAVKLYAEATRTAIAQIQYKKLTGTPTKIDFLEE
jgi:hypothetical protein